MLGSTVTRPRQSLRSLVEPCTKQILEYDFPAQNNVDSTTQRGRDDRSCPTTLSTVPVRDDLGWWTKKQGQMALKDQGCLTNVRPEERRNKRRSSLILAIKRSFFERSRRSLDFSASLPVLFQSVRRGLCVKAKMKASGRKKILITKWNTLN